jgi:hypothetical protein
MSKLIKIGLPSKGRLKNESLKVFKKNKLLIKDSKRNYLSEIKNFSLNLSQNIFINRYLSGCPFNIISHNYLSKKTA